MVIRILADTSLAGAKSTPLRRLYVPAQGVSVRIVAELSTGLEALDGLDRDVLVPVVGDSDPVRFELAARDVGVGSVKVTAWAGGTFLGEMSLQVTIGVDARSVESPPRQVRLQNPKAHRGDVALLVRQQGTGISFQLLARSRHYDPVEVPTLAAEPRDAVERAIADMHKIAIGSSEYEGAQARTLMAETGVGLWRDLVPDTIQDQYWELHRSIGSFTITTGADMFPWELLYPVAPGRDEGFLVDQFPVVRRSWGQEVAERVSVASPTFVVSDGAPSDARQEIDTVQRIVGAAEEPVIDSLGPLHETVNSGTAGLIHFACHNEFTRGTGSQIRMKGGSFRPVLLNRAVQTRILAAERPLVFVNACRSAGAEPEYIHPVSWASQFMAAGAGAFLGTLWSVRSPSASLFAETFYSRFLEDTCTLGEATMAARAAVHDDSEDPTWLAYTVYGDADAVAIRP